MPETNAIKAGKKILICDDEKTVVDFLALFLRKEGFSDVDIAGEAVVALEKIKNTGYNLVLLDIKLPGMDGIQALQEIKAIKPGLDVIMITGYPDVDTAEQAVKLGAYDYIVKPFDLAYFKLAILTKLLLN
ncbi:MAG: response regulator [Candidatus Omnitrophota bacterium]